MPWNAGGSNRAVTGHPGLLALRLGALLLLVVILIDPVIPGEDPAFGDSARPSHWVLVDPDPALAARTTEGTLWDEILALAAAEADAGAALARLSGDRPAGVTRPVLEETGPAETSGEIGEGLIGLAEAGADSLVLLSTLRIAPGPLEEALLRLPVPLRVIQVGGEVRNAALAEFRLPTTTLPDEPLLADVRLVGEGGGPSDSLRLRIESRAVDDGPAEPVLVYDALHPLPPAGEPDEITIELPPPPPADRVRYSARVELAGDGFPADDERVAVVRVGMVEGGVVLISLRPDWEPRTLLPVIERASGLEGEGFLRVGPDRFIPLRSGDDPIMGRTARELAERARSAAILILHGADGDPGGPLTEVVASHPRTLHLPGTPGGAALAGVETTGPVGGEWTPSPQAPPSPIAPYLSASNLGGLPPLSARLSPVGPLPGANVIDLRRTAGDGPEPGLVLVERAGGRSAVALASDFWRWGARAGEPRDIYRNLWAGVTGWLLAHEGPSDPGGVRPDRPVVSRGQPVPWEAFGWEDRPLEIEVRPWADHASDGPVIRTERVRVREDGRFRTPALPPGEYRYAVRSPTGPEPAAGGFPGGPSEEVASGVFEVEAFQGALLRLPLDAEDLSARAAAGASGPTRAREGRGLRTHPLPWLLLLALLSIEWIGRRRIGQR